MRSFLAALVLAASLASPAAAQYPAGPTNQSSLALIAPTVASPTDSSNRIATTAWVNSLVNAGLPLASGKIWIGSAGNIATPQTMSGDATLAIGGALTLATANANVGTFGSATSCITTTQNAKGLTTAISAATCTPALGSITGLGTGVATALAINIGSAGAPVLFNGALGTPSSGVATNLTGTAAGLTAGTVTTNANLTGAVTSAGNATSLGSFTSANLRGALTDESGTGVAYFQGGDIGTPSAGVGTNLTALNASNLSSGTLPPARLGLGQLTNSLGGNVSMTSATTYFDGPSVAQGSTGTWFATGVVTLADGTAIPITSCKLWDGTTIIASSSVQQFSNGWFTLSLSGYLASPVGNIRISCSSSTGTTNIIRAAGQDSTAKASTISAFRIN